MSATVCELCVRRRWWRRLKYLALALLIVIGGGWLADALFGYSASSAIMGAVVLVFFLVWVLDLLGVWKRLERQTGEDRDTGPSE